MMQLIMPQEEQIEKQAIHPIAIFKEGWDIYCKHAGSFSVAYLSIYLPLTVLSLAQMLFTQSAKPSAIGVMAGIISMVVGGWAYMVFINMANRALKGESLRMGESVKGTGRYLLYYLCASIISFVLIALLWVVAGILMAAGAGLLWKINKVAAGIILAAVVIAGVAVSVYFSIRWSLFGILCVTEETGPVAALKRSYALVKDYVTPVVGEYFLIMAISIFSIVPFAVVLNTTIKSKMVISVIYIIYSSIINMVLLPFWNTVLVVLYRKLKEAVG